MQPRSITARHCPISLGLELSVQSLGLVLGLAQSLVLTSAQGLLGPALALSLGCRTAASSAVQHGQTQCDTGQCSVAQCSKLRVCAVQDSTLQPPQFPLPPHLQSPPSPSPPPPPPLVSVLLPRSLPPSAPPQSSPQPPAPLLLPVPEVLPQGSYRKSGLVRLAAIHVSASEACCLPGWAMAEPILSATCFLEALVLALLAMLLAWQDSRPRARTSYFRHPFAAIIFGCLLQGTSAAPPDAAMMAGVIALSDSFGLTALIGGIASIAGVSAAGKLLSLASEACSGTDGPVTRVKGDNKDVRQAGYEPYRGSPLEKATCPKREKVSLPPGLGLEDGAISTQNRACVQHQMAAPATWPRTSVQKRATKSAAAQPHRPTLRPTPLPMLPLPAVSPSQPLRDRRTPRSMKWSARKALLASPARQPAREPVFTPAHCGHIWLQRVQQQRTLNRRLQLWRCRYWLRYMHLLRARVARTRSRLDLLSRPPKPILRDVGYDAINCVFTYRDVLGRVTHEHPASTGTAPQAYGADGFAVAPMLPPAESSVVLSPESMGGFCYYDTALGTAAWSAPDGSKPLRSLAKLAIPCLPLHPPPPLPQDFRIGEMHTQKSGWLALFQDTDSTVTLLHVTTGTVREAPWLALRTPHGEVYFANLVTRETRWLPPHLWQEGFISRHSLCSHEDDPYHVLLSRASVDHRTPLPDKLGRVRVEGGAPYLLDEDSGRPKYPPDVFDTPHTYPLAGYVAVKCSNPYYADLGGTCWELATEYSGDEPTPLGDQANPYALDINQGAPYLIDKEGVAVPMPCSKLRKREGVPRSLRDLVASKRRPSQHLVQRGGSGA